MAPTARASKPDYRSPHEGLNGEQYQRILSAVQWSLLPKERGRPRSTDLGQIIEALLYKAQSGCRWRHLPAPPRFPPWQTVYNYYRVIRKTGEWATLQMHLLHGQATMSQGSYDTARTAGGRSPSRHDWPDSRLDRNRCGPSATPGRGFRDTA